MMRKSIAVRWASLSVYAAVGLFLAALSARPAAAQGFGYAAIAISPSTMWSGAEKGTTTLASVESGALQICQSKGARDCKVYSAVGSCVALATAATPHYGAGSGATREGAAAQAMAECTKGGGLSCVVYLAPCGSDNVNWPS